MVGMYPLPTRCHRPHLPGLLPLYLHTASDQKTGYAWEWAGTDITHKGGGNTFLIERRMNNTNGIMYTLKPRTQGRPTGVGRLARHRRIQCVKR